MHLRRPLPSCNSSFATAESSRLPSMMIASAPATAPRHSCSRDPIGYRGGENLYGNYFGLLLVDPSRNCPRDVCCRFRFGWTILQYTTKQLSCEEGKSAGECCSDYGSKWYRLWALDGFSDGPCEKRECPALAIIKPAPIVGLAMADPLTAVIKKHPVAAVCVAVVLLNEKFIDEQPLNLPRKKCTSLTGAGREDFCRNLPSGTEGERELKRSCWQYSTGGTKQQEWDNFCGNFDNVY